MKFINACNEEYTPQRWLSFNDVLLKPQHSRFDSRNDPEISTATVLGNARMAIPIVSANMDTVTGPEMAIAMSEIGGLGILHRFYSQKEDYAKAIDRVYNITGQASFSIGSGDVWVDFVRECKKRYDKSLVCLDIAHAHSEHAINTVDAIRSLDVDEMSLTIVAGNVATGAAAVDLVEAGANVIKCGIGCGSVCTTRLVTGHGVPQLSSIMMIRKTLNNRDYADVPLIADGGIRHAGDIVKAIAAGASAVMIGQLFAGTTESPGEVFSHSDGSKFKSYRGQSSRHFMNEIGKVGVAAEGVSIEMPYKGSVYEVIKEMVGGIRSGMTYSGAKDFSELREKAEFIEMSEQGWVESMPHATLNVR